MSGVYEVWQKSNETDFLLSMNFILDFKLSPCFEYCICSFGIPKRTYTMNFILFTNQGYPLQNSSLGQLHSNGGIVSIVRSSAGRLLLEYLSARWLRSSEY